MDQDEHPFARPFFLHIQHLQYAEATNVSPVVPGPEFYWRPSPSGQFISRGSSGWWIWDPGSDLAGGNNLGRLRRATEKEIARREWYRTSSLIWDPERHGYIHAPIDCTDASSYADDGVWRRLSFGRHSTPDLAVVGYQRETYHLHLPGPDDWFEQLLPDVYQAQMTGGPTCKLTGHLNILVGLIAFWVEPQHDCFAVNESFRFDTTSTLFQKHRYAPSPRHEKRAMIVEIGYDPERVTSEELHAWEEGDHGEIFS